MKVTLFVLLFFAVPFCVNTVVAVDGKDAIVELTGMYSQRVTSVFAYKPAASDKLL